MFSSKITVATYIEVYSSCLRFPANATELIWSYIAGHRLRPDHRVDAKSK